MHVEFAKVLHGHSIKPRHHYLVLIIINKNISTIARGIYCRHCAQYLRDSAFCSCRILAWPFYNCFLQSCTEYYSAYNSRNVNHNTLWHIACKRKKSLKIQSLNYATIKHLLCIRTSYSVCIYFILPFIHCANYIIHREVYIIHYTMYHALGSEATTY